MIALLFFASQKSKRNEKMIQPKKIHFPTLKGTFIALRPAELSKIEPAQWFEASRSTIV
jgi:hypothetical protein